MGAVLARDMSNSVWLDYRVALIAGKHRSHRGKFHNKSAKPLYKTSTLLRCACFR